MSLDTNHLTRSQEKLIHTILEYGNKLTAAQADAIANILNHKHFVTITGHIENGKPNFYGITDDRFSSVQLCKAGVELFLMYITAETNTTEEEKE